MYESDIILRRMTLELKNSYTFPDRYLNRCPRDTCDININKNKKCEGKIREIGGMSIYEPWIWMRMRNDIEM